MIQRMLPIIHQNINNQEINTVNARDLHKFLESKQDFATWIKTRIEHYEFKENQDFVRFHKKMEANNATLIEYHLSLDMAKQLSMVDRSEQGKEARLYFIECEKKAKQAPTPAVPDFSDHEQTLLFALEKLQENKKLLAITHEQAEVIGKKETVIIEQKGVIQAQEDFIDNAFKLHDTMSVDYYCKLISNKQNHFGAVKFRSLMKISGRFVMNRDTYSYMPSQEMLNSGQMEYKSKQPYVDDNGIEHEHSQIRITKKGARTLYAICKKYQKFFKMNENETRGYHYKPLDERRAFLNSLLEENEVTA